MLNSIIIMRERAAGVVRRVNEDALNLAGELLLKSFQREQIVAKNKFVVENIVVSHAMLRVI